METDQPTPKYDQLKKRFMRKIVNEDSIRELQFGLLRLGQDSRYVCSRFLAKGVRHGNSLDGAMTTMEFLDHCMKTHEKSVLLDEADSFDLEEILGSTRLDECHHEEKSFQWPIQELVEYERTAKPIPSKRSVLLIRAMVPLGERCFRRFKWLIATRMFHLIGKVLDIYIPESSTSVQTADQATLGYLFVTFQNEKEASAAAEAADNFPWPVKGRYNEEGCRFEGLRFRRWKAVVWRDYADQTVNQSDLPRKADSVGANALSSVATLDTATPEPHGEVEALSLKLQTLHRSLDAATSSTTGKASTDIITTVVPHGQDALQSTSTLASPPAKLYSPETKGKIAALLRRSVHEVRLSDTADGVPLSTGASGMLNYDAPPMHSRQGVGCLDRLKDCLRTLRENACSSMTTVTTTINNPGMKRAALNHSDIDRHIEVCARNGDLYEMVGWYQQKIRLLTQDFLDGAQDEYPMSGAKSDGTERLWAASPAVPLRIWEDLQLFLDQIKSEIKSGFSATSATRTPSVDDLHCSANILSTLNEIALLLMSAKSSNKSEFIERLQGTVDHQNDVLERSEERIEELRDKVREYGREIAALEARNEEQRVSLAYHRATGERLVAMERQKTELERERADSDAKIARMQAYIDHLRETVASMEADRHWSRTARILASDSGEYEEAERKTKASDAVTQAPLTASLSPGAARQAARKQAHDLAHGLVQEPTPVSLVQAVSRLQVSDWINAYLYQPTKKTLEDLQVAEAGMAGVQADLEAALVKFKHAKREVLICNMAKKGALINSAKAAQADKERAEKEEQNLCCICQEAVKSILLMPCRHLCVCQVCSEGPPASPRTARQQPQRARMLQSCPVCRAAITECLRVYA